MAKASEQKLKILYLLDILEKYTDEQHPVSMNEILRRLKLRGIQAERKSIYDDIAVLNAYGLQVKNRRGAQGGYYLCSRLFEMPELKLLVDAVQASKFITVKKSEELIKKLESLTSKNKAIELQHSVIMRERIKTMNESVYHNVDSIQWAITQNVKVSFAYFDWNIKKQRQLRRDGKRYKVSPCALTWDDENYYLIAYDEEAQKIKHYRVDKMQNILAEQEPREGVDTGIRFDMAKYSRKMFGMYGGEVTRVKLRCSNSLIGVILDRFGMNTIITPDGDCFEVMIEAAISPVFLSWVMQFGDKVKILSPQAVIDDLKKLAQCVLEHYKI